MRSSLMVQGTTSDAGKSTLVAGLCRLLFRRGIQVAPFKPQNMALNSAVTADGGEIGRAQALQAQAAGIPPTVDMNPVLIKPNSDTGAQLIVRGRVHANFEAHQFGDYKPALLNSVLESYRRLQAEHQCVLIEGAGSPAEINLRENDIANMGFAEAADCPVILVADIDRGGVFAHLVGTLELLSESERERVRGFVINRFRGDVEILKPGLEWLQQRTQRPVLGVLPYLTGLQLDAEDAIRAGTVEKPAARLRVVVPVLPRISNHTDLDPLAQHPDVDLLWVGPRDQPPPAELVILPGSKSVRSDLAHLRAQGWAAYLQRHLRYGGRIIGICGGMQMLGRSISDPHGIEGAPGDSDGLGWLDLSTEIGQRKQLRQVAGRLMLEGQVRIRGYEIHAGISQGRALENPFADLGTHRDGAISNDGQIIGTYLHGLFDEGDALQSLLRWAGLESAEAIDINAVREASLERLADTIEAQLDLTRLSSLLGLELESKRGLP